MRQQTILKKLEKMNEQKTMRSIAKKMGYRSPTSVHNWLNGKPMSEKAQARAANMIRQAGV